jgi:transposase
VEKMQYQNKDVYLGIDVHKRTYKVCCLCEGLKIKTATMPGSPEKLVIFMQRHFRGARIHTAYEAGFSGFVLHRFLASKGIDSIVVNPASILVAARDKVKTDKRDALKIATQLSTGNLKGILIPSLEQENRRLLTRTREQLVGERTRLSNQIKSKLYQFGLISFDDKRPVSEAFLEHYLNLELSYELKESVGVLSELWRIVTEKIKKFRSLLGKQATQDKRLQQVYESTPGIGPIGARILSNELGDLSQFSNEKKLFGFLGFTPSENSSGEARRQGHISRQGSGRLRWILTEAAWRAVEKDPALAADYRRIAAKAGNKKALVAIARRLIARIRACFRKKEFYQLGHESLAA